MRMASRSSWLSRVIKILNDIVYNRKAICHGLVTYAVWLMSGVDGENIEHAVHSKHISYRIHSAVAFYNLPRSAYDKRNRMSRLNNPIQKLEQVSDIMS